MIEVGIGKKNGGDGCVARRRTMRVQFWRAFDLPSQVWRSVEQDPVATFGAYGNARLRLWCDPTSPRGDTVLARAIPLRQTAARGAAKNSKPNQLPLRDQIAPA